MKEKLLSILKNKKIVAIALAFVMVVATGIFVIPGALNAKASEGIEPNEVAEGMLDVKMQIQKNEDGVNYDMRLVSSVNGLGYYNVGFEVGFDSDGDGIIEDGSNGEDGVDEVISWTTYTVLERINASKTGVTYQYSPKVIDTDAEYFITGVLKGIDANKLENDFYVRAFATSLDDKKTVTYGTGRYFNISDATADGIVNIPVRVAGKPNTDSTGKITDAVTMTLYNADKTTTTVENVVAYLENYDENVAYGDATTKYAHISVEVPAGATKDGSTKKVKLPSASAINIGDKAAIYRNLESSRAVNGSDESWYHAYKAAGASAFVIVTDADLYGFSSRATTHQFNGQAVYQVSDITVNAGTANANGFTATSGTVIPWTPIGPNENPFVGTFDGQNHSISGLSATGNNFVGLFGKVLGGTVKNVQLENSYFNGTGTANGGIVGRANGTFENLSVKAYVNSGGGYVGGIIGQMVANSGYTGASTDTVIKNCKVNGKVAATGNFSGGFVGQTSGGTLSISDSFNYANVTATGERAGGFVGDLNHKATIANCVNYGTIQTTNHNSGGFIGLANGGVEVKFTSCLNKGTVSTNNQAGGFIATSLAKISFENCQNGGSVTIGTGNFVGGFIGFSQSANAKFTISNCLNTGTITSTGNTFAGGFIGRANSNGSIEKSFNSGSIVTASGARGSIIAQLIDNYTVTVSATYATTESCSQTLYKQDTGTYTDGNTTYTAAGNATSSGYVTQLSAANLKGITGYNNTPKLDYDNYWITVANGTPQLKSFQTSGAVDMDWYEESQEAGKEIFVVETAEQLYTVAEIANQDATFFAGKTIQLANDIVLNEGTASANGFETVDGSEPYQWVPIASFSGTFDGQGHAIQGLYINSSAQGLGLFKQTNTASVVKNLKLTNGYVKSTYNTDGNAYVGSLAGTGNGTFEQVYSNVHVSSTRGYAGGFAGRMTIQAIYSECWFDGSLTVTTSGEVSIGGLVGFTAQNENTAGKNGIKCEMLHCLNTAPITTTNGSFVGGLCGWSRVPSLKVVDSLNVGTILPTPASTSVTRASIVGRVQGGTTCTVQNTYAADNCVQAFYGLHEAVKKGDGVHVSTSSSDLNGLAGYQKTTLDFDNYWVAVEGKTPELKVFKTGDALSTSGVKKTLIEDSSWFDSNATELTIHTVEQLLNFVTQSKRNHFVGKTIRLATDLRLNTGNNEDWAKTAPGIDWNVIGTADWYFGGTFDGQGHTLSGLYSNGTANDIGLFARIGAVGTTGTVQDFRLENSYFVTSGQFVGGIAARMYQGIVQGVYVDAIIKAGGGYVGGIAGWTRDADNTITNCCFAGEVASTEQGFRTGGMVGCVDSNTTISYCVNTGTVSGQVHGYTGGMVGFVPQNHVTIENCLNIGAMSYKSGTTGSIIARVAGSSKGATIKNTYAYDASCNLTVYADANVQITYYDANGVEQTEAAAGGAFEKAVTKISKANLTGEAAKTNAPNLDWTNYWTTTDGFPALQSFTEKDVMKVLLIGNSFCWYHPDELYGVANAADVEMKIYNVYASGCPLSKHWEWYKSGTAYAGNDPSIQITDANGQKTIKGLTLDDCLGLEDWDVISLQTSSKSTYASVDDFIVGETGTNGIYLSSMKNMLQDRCPDARMMWHRTWDYEVKADDTTGKFPTTREQQLAYYNNHEQFITEFIKVNYTDLDIVPTGNAWEAAREGGIIGLTGSSVNGSGDAMATYGDYYHDGDIGGGQYLNACVWFEVLTGKSCIGNTYTPSYTLNTYDGVTDTKTALQQYAHDAVAEYYTVK